MNKDKNIVFAEEEYDPQCSDRNDHIHGYGSDDLLMMCRNLKHVRLT